MKCSKHLVLYLIISFLSKQSFALNWPNWLGPNYNGSVDESFDAVSFVDPNSEKMLNDHENFHPMNTDVDPSDGVGVDEGCIEVEESRRASSRSSSIELSAPLST